MLCVTTSAPCIQQPCHAWYARMGFAGNRPDQPDTALQGLACLQSLLKVRCGGTGAWHSWSAGAHSGIRAMVHG